MNPLRFFPPLAVACAAATATLAQPILSNGHADVGVGYEGGAWDLHVHDGVSDTEYEPDGVILRVGHAAETTVPGDTRYAFLGAAGSPIWILPETEQSGLLFLGLGTEEILPGIFLNDQVRLALKDVHGPGHFFLYHTDAFGNPIVAMNSADGIDAADQRVLPVASHSHVNWAFSAPGQYHIALQASGTLVDGGIESASEVVEYHFNVAPETRVDVALQTGPNLVLSWLSEPGIEYHLEHRQAFGQGEWEPWGDPLEGTGERLEVIVPVEPSHLWFRLEIHEEHHHDDGVLGRLLVADAEEAHLTVIDLDTGEVHQDGFPLTSRAYGLLASPSGRFGFTVETDGDIVQIFDGGIYVEEHGDHQHAYEKPLEKLSLTIEGANPVHAAARGDWVTIFHDGAGKASLVNELQLAALGEAYQPLEILAGLQHGAVIPVGADLFAVTLANPDYPTASPDPLPIGAQILDRDGNSLHEAPGCSMLHGEAGNGHSAAFGCAHGVLILEPHEDDFHDFLIPNPESLAAPFRIGELRGHDALHHYFGHAIANDISDGLYLIEPDTRTMTQVVPGTPRPVAFEITPDAHELLVLLANGDLLVLDAATGAVENTVAAVIGPVSNHENHGQYHPAVTAGMGRVFIADPANDRIVELDLQTLEVHRTFHVHGTPTKLALLGVKDAGHDHDHDSDHEHEGN